MNILHRTPTTPTRRTSIAPEDRSDLIAAVVEITGVHFRGNTTRPKDIRSYLNDLSPEQAMQLAEKDDILFRICAAGRYDAAKIISRAAVYKAKHAVTKKQLEELGKEMATA